MSQSTFNTTFPSSSTGIVYSPSDAWYALAEPGATNGQAEFDLTDQANGYGNSFITWTFPQPATGLEYWAYQRSDGGLFSICFDCPATSTLGDRIDALNTSTNGTEPPRLLYSKYDLSYAIHNLTIANLFDSRATILGATDGGYGQMTMDRFVIVSPLNPPSTSTTGSQSSTTSAASTTFSSSPSPSSDAGLGGNAPSSSNTGAIVGGVVGGVAVILIAVLCVLLYRSLQRRRQASEPQTFAPKAEGTTVQPFILDGNPLTSQTTSQQPSSIRPPYPAASSSASGPSVGSASVHHATGVPYVPVWSDTPGMQSSNRVPEVPGDVVSRATSDAAPSIRAHTIASSSARRRDTTSPRREQDAGFLLGDDDLDEASGTLPPDYHAALVGKAV